MDKIYPVLKPGTWVGLKSGALRQTLIGTKENPMLVIAYARDVEDRFEFLSHTYLEGKNPTDILNNANDNLENFEQEFEISENEHGKWLYASGKDYSSEKILCKNHMMKAHELLDAKELLVSIPRRRCLLAISKDAKKENIETFLKVHNHTWQDDSFGNAQIINGLFVVIDGEIQQLLSM